MYRVRPRSLRAIKVSTLDDPKYFQCPWIAGRSKRRHIQMDMALAYRYGSGGPRRYLLNGKEVCS